jgi:ATP-binding cassette, subfamily F, member 3
MSATIDRAQRIGVVGVNGAGKTTLLKLLAQEVPPDVGSVSLGHNVVMGYYAQHHAEKLDKGKTIIEELRQLAADKPESHVRGILGAFLFSGDDVDKRIGVLSGGERARVALAKLLLVPANFMLMDEPTNHLDLDSSEMLIEALKSYGGTLIFVSHNRSFVNQLATHIWEVRDGGVQIFPGNLDDYLDDYLYHQAKAHQPVAKAEPELRASGTNHKDRKRVEAEERQRKSALVTPLKKEIARMEARIGQLEELVKAREAELADPVLYNDFVRAKPLLQEHRAAKEELDALYQTWEKVQQKLAAVE